MVLDLAYVRKTDRASYGEEIMRAVMDKGKLLGLVASCLSVRRSCNMEYHGAQLQNQ